MKQCILLLPKKLHVSERKFFIQAFFTTPS